LVSFATALFSKAGMDEEKASVVADLLVLTDRLGRRTHGLAMAPLYLAEIEKGTMAVTGAPEVVSNRGAAQVWDGNYLPGLWLMKQAIDAAIPVAQQFGVGCIAIRRSHHIGCLAALAKLAADRGFVAMIANSDPSGARVAPFGGTEALYTPNPFALGYASRENPVLIDICASITTVSLTREKYAAGEHFEQPWLIDHEGRPTTDPAVLEHSEPRGSLLPVGGLDHGHKGFGLGIMIEALSQGLSGHGRSQQPKRWGGNTLLQVFDPAMFSGRDVFAEEVNYFADRVRTNRPADPKRPVRMPGDNARIHMEAADRDGLSYDPRIWAGLLAAADKLGVSPP
jgi:L-lactate dehydrogenase